MDDRGESMTRTSRRILALALVIVPFALLVVACGGDDDAGTTTATTATATASSTTTVDVALGTADNEYALVPDPAQVPAGTVTFSVKNGGTMEHEMVVIRTDKAASDLAEANGEADETGAVDEIVLAAGDSGELTVDLDAGHYALVCNLPGHYAAGMYADFTVQ
jgi:uncharacterized cupredoxin-like copper-binding protein